MFIKIEESKKGFKPFNITIETEIEAKWLWYLFNHNGLLIEKADKEFEELDHQLRTHTI